MEEQKTTHQTIDNQQRILSMDRFEYGKASYRMTLNFWSISELENKLKELAKLQEVGLMPADA
jgi:hypothetical protein